MLTGSQSSEYIAYTKTHNCPFESMIVLFFNIFLFYCLVLVFSLFAEVVFLPSLWLIMYRKMTNPNKFSKYIFDWIRQCKCSVCVVFYLIPKHAYTQIAFPYNYAHRHMHLDVNTYLAQPQRAWVGMQNWNDKVSCCMSISSHCVAGKTWDALIFIFTCPSSWTLTLNNIKVKNSFDKLIFI